MHWKLILWSIAYYIIEQPVLLLICLAFFVLCPLNIFFKHSFLVMVDLHSGTIPHLVISGSFCTEFWALRNIVYRSSSSSDLISCSARAGIMELHAAIPPCTVVLITIQCLNFNVNTLLSWEPINYMCRLAEGLLSWELTCYTHKHELTCTITTQSQNWQHDLSQAMEDLEVESFVDKPPFPWSKNTLQKLIIFEDLGNYPLNNNERITTIVYIVKTWLLMSLSLDYWMQWVDFSGYPTGSWQWSLSWQFWIFLCYEKTDMCFCLYLAERIRLVQNFQTRPTLYRITNNALSVLWLRINHYIAFINYYLTTNPKQAIKQSQYSKEGSQKRPAVNYRPVSILLTGMCWYNPQITSITRSMSSTVISTSVWTFTYQPTPKELTKIVNHG